MAAFAGLSNHRERTASTSSASDADNIKRRTSNRNIKRPKFDDELVESSLKGQAVPFFPKLKARNSVSLSVPDSPSFSYAVSSVPETRKRPHSKTSPSVPAKKAKKTKPTLPGTSKETVRWKPADDLTLILSVQQTCDLAAVFRGVKFSCKFSLQELQDRWYSLLYEPTVSKVAQQAMKNLHPEQIHFIQSKLLYSKAEEELLAGITSNTACNVSTCERLLLNHADVFHVGRTARALHTQWLLMKQYYLLKDQHPYGKPGNPPEFSELEEKVLERDPKAAEYSDQKFRHEDAVAKRTNAREMRHLEDKISHQGVLVDTVTGIAPTEFDTSTIAILKGRLVRYLIRSNNATFGRVAANNHVDIDLSLEGPAWKVSRRQGFISLRADSQFLLYNEGARAVMVDGRPVLQGHHAAILNNTTIEVGMLKFSFLINAALINDTVKSEQVAF